MKLTIVVLLLGMVHVSASVYSQTSRFTLKAENRSVLNILQKIEETSEYRFFYQNEQVDVNRQVSAEIVDLSIEQVLNKIFAGQDVTYKIMGGNLILLSTDREIRAPETTQTQQQKTVSGKVTDETGQPLPGVTVIIKGTTQGTITDTDGSYTLTNIPQDAVLVFSFVGMRTEEIAAGIQTNINVQMQANVIGIDEVVAVGYGTQKKINLTGSVESIEGRDLARQPVAQASQALGGLIPGLTAIQSSGQPGQDNATLRIRGIGSIGASNNPLILIDGIEGDINDIDANDILNMSVLKDAASASIYGSRASNGVILITTKRAQKSTMTVNYKNYVGWQDITTKPEFLNALDYLKYTGSTQAEIDEYAENHKTNPDIYPDTDWVDLLFSENGFQQYHNISVNGGSEKIGILASLSYIDQGANIRTYNFLRYNGRFNTDITVSDKFNINFDLSFHKSKSTAPAAGLSEVVRQAYRIPPIYHAIHSDGSWGFAWNSQNPIAQVTDGGYDMDFDNYFRGILKANYNPIPELNFSVMYAPEYNDGYNKFFERIFYTIVDWESKITQKMPNRNTLAFENTRSFTDNFNTLAAYTKTLNNHHFSVLGGYEFIKFQQERFGASRTDFILQDYQVLDAGSEENDANYGSATHWSLVSYFARLNYSFKDRYLMEANIRRDASSRFAEANRVGVFPSFSVGWRVSEEEFLKGVRNLSNLKLRASWGELGNQQIGRDFPYVSSIALGNTNYILNDAVVTGAAQQVLANRDIKWETTETINAGVDAGLFDQRFTFSAEYYIRKTRDILLQLPIPYVIGLSPSTQNAGNVENRGWDFSGNWQDKINNFTYRIGFNISDVKNEVTNLAGVGPIISGVNIIEVGSPINLIYGYESIGIFQDQASIASAPPQFGTLQVGNIQYKDQLTVDTDNDGIPDQADGKINPDDRVTLGNPFPRYNYGINLGAEYKGFDFSVSMQGVGKRDVLLGGDLVWALFNAGKIQKWHIEEFWSPENTDAKFPIISPTSSGSNDIQTSSTWVFDAAYLRLRNITLGYTLPKTLLDRISIKDIRVYVSGQNLFTLDNLPKGVDPLSPNNTQGALYPITANYNIGIDVKF